MRLKVSGDKSEIRQSYIPSLFPHIVQPLMEKGAVRLSTHAIVSSSLMLIFTMVMQSAVDDTIEFMDEYFLTREDWDTIVELGVGDNNDTQVLKKISTATKTSFTKKCVPSRHPDRRCGCRCLRVCPLAQVQLPRPPRCVPQSRGAWEGA